MDWQHGAPLIKVAADFESVAGGGEDDGAALFLVEDFRACAVEAGAQGGFVRSFAEGVGAVEYDDRRTHGAEKCFGRGEVCAVAADDHDIAAQFIAVASNEGVFGGRTGIGHEQEAEAFEVNAGDDALVVGLTGGLAG